VPPPRSVLPDRGRGPRAGRRRRGGARRSRGGGRPPAGASRFSPGVVLPSERPHSKVPRAVIWKTPSGGTEPAQASSCESSRAAAGEIANEIARSASARARERTNAMIRVVWVSDGQICVQLRVWAARGPGWGSRFLGPGSIGRTNKARQGPGHLIAGLARDGGLTKKISVRTDGSEWGSRTDDVARAGARRERRKDLSALTPPPPGRRRRRRPTAARARPRRAPASRCAPRPPCS
jgi:hypothetical protein